MSNVKVFVTWIYSLAMSCLSLFLLVVSHRGTVVDFSEQHSLGGLTFEFAELGGVLRLWLLLLEEAFICALVERYHVGAIREV